MIYSEFQDNKKWNKNEKYYYFGLYGVRLRNLVT